MKRVKFDYKIVKDAEKKIMTIAAEGLREVMFVDAQFSRFRGRDSINVPLFEGNVKLINAQKDFMYINTADKPEDPAKEDPKEEKKEEKVEDPKEDPKEEKKDDPEEKTEEKVDENPENPDAPKEGEEAKEKVDENPEKPAEEKVEEKTGEAPKKKKGK